MSNHKLEIAGFGFVDDVDLCITDTSQDGKQVCNRMHESINMWSGLLHATGGALVPEKCFWYYVHNNWDKGHWKYDTTPQAHGMYVLDNNGRPALIPQLQPSEACRTLGICLALDGNNKDELQYLLEVAKGWQTLMSAAIVTHAAVEFGLRQVILRKLEYPLVATTFTLNECNKLMSPILSAGLPAAGFTRTFPRAIVHGPWQWGGLNITNLFMGQTIKHIHMVMKFGNKLSDIMGSLLQAAYEAFHMDSGLSGKIVDFLECVYTYVTSTWLTHTWESCRTSCIQVLGEKTDYKPQQQGDVELM